MPFLCYLDDNILGQQGKVWLAYNEIFCIYRCHLFVIWMIDNLLGSKVWSTVPRSLSGEISQGGRVRWWSWKSANDIIVPSHLYIWWLRLEVYWWLFWLSWRSYVCQRKPPLLNSILFYLPVQSHSLRAYIRSISSSALSLCIILFVTFITILSIIIIVSIHRRKELKSWCQRRSFPWLRLIISVLSIPRVRKSHSWSRNIWYEVERGGSPYTILWALFRENPLPTPDYESYYADGLCSCAFSKHSWSWK